MTYKLSRDADKCQNVLVICISVGYILISYVVTEQLLISGQLVCPGSMLNTVK